MIANELLVNRLWYRTKAKIKWFFSFPDVEPSIARPSPITKLPRELVEIIISYFVYDKYSLIACSMTCYSWYMVAVSYLHHSLTTDEQRSREGTTRYLWPGPLKESYKLGLLPLVKQFQVRMSGLSWFSSDRLSRRTLRYFSALTNVQELEIERLQLPDFMPRLQLCFGHFSPTLRFLDLKEPRGSHRQILYFVGLFPNLQDLRLSHHYDWDEVENADDATLVPLSVPPLRGWLTLRFFTWEDLVKDMIFLFGGLRFRRMDLQGEEGLQYLLDACTGTLETLRLYPPYTRSEEFLETSREKKVNVELKTIFRVKPSICHGTNASGHSRPRHNRLIWLKPRPHPISSKPYSPLSRPLHPSMSL